MKFRTCERCGASLDFGEKCDCFEIKRKRLDRLMTLLSTENNGQIKMDCKEISRR